MRLARAPAARPEEHRRQPLEAFGHSCARGARTSPRWRNGFNGSAMRLVDVARRVVHAVVSVVGAERARLSEPTRPSLSMRVAWLSGIALVVWGNTLVLVGRAAGDDRRVLVTIAGQAVAIILVIALLAGPGRFSAAELGWKPARLRGAAGKILAGAAAVVVVALLVAAFRRNHCTAEGGTAVNVARLLAATALGEEILFRGALFAVWSRTIASDPVLVAANCGLFALWHVTGAVDDGALMAVVNVVGPGLGALLLFLPARCRFSWVLAAAVLHATTNLPVWVFENCV